MIKFTVPFSWYSLGQTDLYGKRDFSPPVFGRLCPIRLTGKQSKTSFRATVSATQGQAFDLTQDTLFLVPPAFLPIQYDDLIEVDFVRYRVVMKRPQYDIKGNLNHVEIGCAAWVSE